MSRIGKNPVPTPAGVTVKLAGRNVSVKGPKGELTFTAPEEVSLAHGPDGVTVTPRDQSPRVKAMWGMSRAIIANNVKGVTEGFEKTLELQGVGYRAAMQGKNLQLQLGYSHDVIYEPPAGITIATPRPVEIKVSGIDAQVVGQVAAEIREYRKPEPYKGKGVRYQGEFVRRKEGKKK